MEELASGALVRATECAICQPWDMVKTRHHLNRGVNPSPFASLAHIYAEGGLLRFYRGVGPEFCGMVPKNASMYAAYEWTRRALKRHTALDDVTIAFVAGVVAGPAETAVVQPFQVVKVRMQTKEFNARYASSLDCAAHVLRSEGVGGFFRVGVSATLWRNTVWNSVYFGSMAKMRAATVDMPHESGSSWRRKLLDLASGFGCGVLATCFNAPFDVAKSRQQSQLPGSARPYGGTFATLARIASEEGLAACYAGFQAKALRMGLAGLVGLSSFDAAQWLLSKAPT